MATEKLEVYRCGLCGNMVEVLRSAGGTLVCCSEKMSVMSENTTDAATEKHVPLIENIDGGVRVSVGSVAHPMDDKHFIEWIQLTVDGKAYRQFLNPGDKPEAVFPVQGNQLTAREFCNLHRMWRA